MTSREELIKRTQDARIPKKKPEQKPIAKQSEKKKKEISEAKKVGTDEALDQFFESARKKMSGVCQCGCTQKSQKHDDTFYRFCVCHIFPKRIFRSIETHPLNWVERTFWGGHHTNFDEQGMDKWPMYADWDDIKEKFHVLVPLLTEEERTTKFYSILEALVYNKETNI
jgi:hypothetical protein